MRGRRNCSSCTARRRPSFANSSRPTTRRANSGTWPEGGRASGLPSLRHLEARAFRRGCVRRRRAARAVIRTVESSVAADRRARAAVCRGTALGQLARGRAARICIRTGLVRRRRLVGLYQHARLWADAGTARRRRNGGVLRISLAVSGAGAGGGTDRGACAARCARRWACPPPGACRSGCAARC